MFPIGPGGKNLGEGELCTLCKATNFERRNNCTFSEKIKHKMQRELV